MEDFFRPDRPIPVTPRKGNKYIMIMYDYDSNNILGEAMKSKSGDKLVRTFTKIHEQLKNHGNIDTPFG